MSDDATDRRSRIAVEVNGRTRHADVDAGATLLHTIRDEFDLTGAKPVCEVGTCGACTVLLDDVAVYSCLVLGAECEGRRVDTVEGLADGSELSPLQTSFAQCDALQCGYCTPGQLMSLEGLRRNNPDPSDDEIESAVQGNLCRCGAYRHILEAAHRAFGDER
ncbi:(2Fe-2S)-binding protein [Ilumatobacter nonamiensis]|uniref:(2Fe-2S)-binding protein n=1 Tax=Ilumatobacter nonamiensis TaxID=467093 RepID=UPI00034A8B2A|nr:(2Fe-2S)-binding protein [Ilumatobacter nonamiensis]